MAGGAGSAVFESLLTTDLMEMETMAQKILEMSDLFQRQLQASDLDAVEMVKR